MVVQEKIQLAQGKVEALLRCGATAASAQQTERLVQEADDAEEQVRYCPTV